MNKNFHVIYLINLVTSWKIVSQISSNGLECKHFQQELWYVKVSNSFSPYISEGELFQSIKHLRKVSPESSLLSVNSFQNNTQIEVIDYFLLVSEKKKKQT